jgi:hypothetical protein
MIKFDLNPQGIAALAAIKRELKRSRDARNDNTLIRLCAAANIAVWQSGHATPRWEALCYTLERVVDFTQPTVHSTDHRTVKAHSTERTMRLAISRLLQSNPDACFGCAVSPIVTRGTPTATTATTV